MTGAIGRDVQAGSKLGHERLSNATEEAVWQMQNRFSTFRSPKASPPPKATNICVTAVRRRRNMP